MSDTKPKAAREFWIAQEFNSNRALIRYAGEKYPEDVNGEPTDNWLHVIEYSAYEQQKAGYSLVYEVKEQLRKENAALLEVVKIQREALKFYASRNNFENGQIISSDIEPAVKVEGRLVCNYTNPPTETQTWVGGAKARQALASTAEKLKALGIE